ncbi:MAG: dTMP kinase [Cyanobacteriota bacterium]|nr:dTMP kinase [Cyanobacteriota bacterium]
MSKGWFITLEGGEGAGKTTQQRCLAARLTDHGYACVCTHEPGGTPLGQSLRRLLLDHGDASMDPYTELLLFIADRNQHVVSVIKPALAAGKIVLCDRFIDSTRAYQGYGRGLDPRWIEDLNQLAQQQIAPHLTLWLDVPYQIGLQRAQKRRDPNNTIDGAKNSTNDRSSNSSVLDRMEQSSLDFHQKIYQGFSNLAKQYSERIQRIDGHQPVEQVSEQIWQVVSSKLGISQKGN